MPLSGSHKTQLLQLVEALSDDECKQLLTTVQDVAAGERFWEGDSGLLYNEFVKLRYFKLSRNAQTAPVREPAFVPIPITKGYYGAERIRLPESASVDVGLGDVLMLRRSRRTYTGATISAAQLSALLQYSAGVTGVVQGYGLSRLPMRTFPSHGGLQSPELYVSVQGIDEIPLGLYHYHAFDHALELLKSGDHRLTVRAFAFDESYVEHAAAVFFVTGCYDRLRWKYGERAYRFMCIDAGFLGENLYLVAEGLGLGGCAISGFGQDIVEEFLGIDGKDEIALFLFTVGVLAI